MQKTKHIKKTSLNYMASGNIKTTFDMYLIRESSQQRFERPWTAFLWLSQNKDYITFPHSQKLMHC